MKAERKAQIAIATIGAITERLALETAILKDDFVGIATHAKKLAQHHAKVSAASMPASDTQNTITVSVQCHDCFDVDGIVEAVNLHNTKEPRH